MFLLNVRQYLEPVLIKLRDQILDGQRYALLLHFFDMILTVSDEQCSQHTFWMSLTSRCSYQSHCHLRYIYVPQSSSDSHKIVTTQLLLPRTIIWTIELSVLKYAMGALMGHHQAEGFLRVHLHVNELLHIEAQHIVIIAASIPIHEHRLPAKRIGEVLNHSWLWYAEEVTCRLDGIPDVILGQSKTAESPAQSKKLIHRWPFVELPKEWTVKEVGAVHLINPFSTVHRPSASHQASFPSAQ